MTTPAHRLLTRVLVVPVAAAVVLTGVLPAGAADRGTGLRRVGPAPSGAAGTDPGYPLDHGTDRLSPRQARKAAQVTATPTVAYEMPFPCGQVWTGSTRSSHSPSAYSVDWNRLDDYGDPVVAAAPGVVTVADTVVDSGYGKWVVVDHGGGETSLYAHMSALSVKVGQNVDQGTQLGLVGDTGNTTGPHLHFEERIDGHDVAPYFHGSKFAFGTSPSSQNCPDVPLAANMNGGLEAEPVFFTRSTPATFTIQRLKRSARTIVFGQDTDEPVLGDWDGDGHANVGVRTPATRTFTLQTADGNRAVVWGKQGDKPLAGDWDGDGTSDLGLRRSSASLFLLRSAGGSVTRVKLGDSNDLGVTGDWNGDGITDIGVYDQATATYTLRLVDGDGLAWFAYVVFGSAGDLPVVGDWDGNDKTDLGAWSPSTGVLSQRRAKAPTSTTKVTVTTLTLGHPR
ncbi:MAG: M23 family metallopeptidase [Nocardioidaceae bacterium]